MNIAILIYIYKSLKGELKTMMKKRILAGVLAAMMVFSMTACGSKKNDASSPAQTGNQTEQSDVKSTSKYDTLVIGSDALNAVWNPLFYTTNPDAMVLDMIWSPISVRDKDGVLIDWMGHIDQEDVKADDGHSQVLYTIKLNEGVKNSDGSAVTIDDVIFTYMCLSDPSYDGTSTFNSLDIVGLKDYLYDTPDYNKLLKDVEAKYSPDKISFEDFLEYCKATNIDNWFGGDITADIGDGRTWSEYLVSEGVFKEDEAKKMDTPEKMLEAVAKVEYEKYKENYDAVSYFKKQIAKGNLEDGIDVTEISGIKKIDDLTCTVLMDSVDIIGDINLANQNILSKAYYGKDFKKGDLSSLKALTSAPMGNGPYVFESYDNNIVTLKANENFFKGTPKIPNLKFQVVNSEDKVDKVLNGELDITDPSASLEIVQNVKDNPDKASYSLVDNAGYGYIAINAKTVPDVNVRKGLMHLMNRKPAVSSYYGELAQVIERPMVPTLPEYPNDAKEYYGYDVEKAKEYFEKAGYTLKAGKLVDKKGNPLVINAGIGDAKSHPSTPILTQMKNDLEAMGGDLVVNDLQFNVLSDKVESGALDMWVMAWGNSKDCDLTQIFSSKGGSNRHCYYNDKLDGIIAKVKQTLDLEERRKLVAEELDIIMDAAVYMPVYQRKNMEIYNAATINLETLPKEVTPYWSYPQEIETVEMQ